MPRGRCGAKGGKTGTLSATLDGTGLEVSRLAAGARGGQVAAGGAHGCACGRRGAWGDRDERRSKRGGGSMVATMAGGSVSQQMVELASTDVAGAAAVVDDDDSAGVRPGGGGVAGWGGDGRAGAGAVVAGDDHGAGPGRCLAEYARRRRVASEARTTAALALDIPVRVSGRSRRSVYRAGRVGGGSFDPCRVRSRGASQLRSALRRSGALVRGE